MDFSTIVTLSCVFTTIAMGFLGAGTYFFVRYGSQGAMMLINKLLNRGGSTNEKVQAESQVARPAIASSEALIQRARALDFPVAPPVSGMASAQQFSAQGAPTANFGQPQTPTLRPHDPLGGYGNAPVNTTGGFAPQQPLSPALSPSRPYQGGGFPAPQPQFGTQGMPPQQGNFGGQGLQPQQPQFGTQTPPQQGNFGAPPMPQLRPAQGGFNPNPPQGNFQPLSPQGGQMRPPMPPQAGGLGNPAYPQQPPNPQQGGMNALGDYRPDLQPRGFANNDTSGNPGLRSRRDNNRKADDYEVYDDGDILGNLGL